MGVVDLIRNCAYTYADDGEQTRVEIPAEMADQAEEYRNALLEAVAETSDELLDKYLSGEELTEEEIIAAIRKATIANEMVPVVCGTSYRNKGVQLLLDAIVDFMPSPLDIPPMQGTKPGDEETEVIRHASDDEPFAALAFKIVSDPFVGKLAYVRVYSGTITSGSYVYNSTKGRRERVGRILQMQMCIRDRCCTLPPLWCWIPAPPT